MAAQTDFRNDRPPERLAFIDALRVAVIAFVIVHHAAQAYGPTGGFWPVHDRAQIDWFAPFYTANAAFGMGLMFLLAGYFVPSSYDRKGVSRFLKGRLLRVGVPLGAFVLLVHLPIVYLLSGKPAPPQFIAALYERGWQPIYLHLWFIAHLLLYCLAYAILRRISERRGGVPRKWPLPSHAAIMLFIAALASITWLVRIRYPIDMWVPLLWVLPAEPAHLPQYVALFAVGALACRGDWLRKLPTGIGLIWLAVGLIAGAGIYVSYGLDWWSAVMAPGGSGIPSLIRSFWETVIAVALSIGLITAFRELFNRSSHLLEEMTMASFGAYILHPAIVVALQAAIKDAEFGAFTKFGIV